MLPVGSIGELVGEEVDGKGVLLAAGVGSAGVKVAAGGAGVRVRVGDPGDRLRVGRGGVSVRVGVEGVEVTLGWSGVMVAVAEAIGDEPVAVAAVRPVGA